MRETHDAQSKDSLEVLLDDVGTVVRGQEVAAVAAQRFDLWFTPDPARHDERMRRGLLGALVDDPAGCALEPFRNTPGVADLDDCARKLSNHRHGLALAAARRTPPTTPARPWVVVLSPGNPVAARAEYGLTKPHSPGVYRTPQGVGLVVVVLSALPRTRATLALRLLARGPTFTRALRELEVLSRDAWEHRFVRVLLRWRRPAGTSDSNPTDEDNDPMKLSEEYRLWKEQYDAELRRAGRKVGQREGRFKVLTQQFEHKLRRTLTDAERDTLRARLRARGSAVSNVVLDLDATALEAWLASPDAH